MNSVRLNEDETRLLEKFMKDKKIKNKSQAIRECIKIAVAHQDINSFIFDINNKINRLVYNVTMTRKLLEQLFVNFGLKKNLDVKHNECLNEFKEINNKYRDNFLG